MSNPFSPSYGISPKVFLGRDDIIKDFMYGLENGVGDPNRSTILSGARGTGKTVVLKEIEGVALQAGWISAYTIMKHDFLDDLYEETRRKCEEHINLSAKRKTTGIAIWQFSISWENFDGNARWESKMYELLSVLTEKDVGVVFQIDEVRGNSEQLRRFAAFFQQHKDRLKIALVMAGISHHVDSVLSDKVISFLRRSRLKQLGPLSISEAIALTRETFSLSEKRIEENAICLIAEKSGGLPYLVQLLGYEVWESAGKEVDLKQAQTGIKKAETYVGSSLIELVLQELSLTDRDFVFGLARLETPASIGDLMEQTAFDRNKLNQYRRRLEKEGVVFSPQRGYVNFVIPFMKAYLTRRDEEL